MLESWELAKSGGRHNETQLTAAFLPAVRSQLLNAYGWYLLAVSGEEESSATEPPTSVSDLERPPAGRAIAPEIREFSSLEHDGWLAELLADPGNLLAADRPDRALLGSDKTVPGYPVVRAWEKSLEAAIQRMDDSLVES